MFPGIFEHKIGTPHTTASAIALEPPSMSDDSTVTRDRASKRIASSCGCSPSQ